MSHENDCSDLDPNDPDDPRNYDEGQCPYCGEFMGEKEFENDHSDGQCSE